MVLLSSEGENALTKLLYTAEFTEDDFISFVTMDFAKEKWVPKLLNNNKRRIMLKFSIDVLMETENPLLLKRIINFMLNIEANANSPCCNINFTKILDNFYEKLISDEAQSIVEENPFVPSHELILQKIILFYQCGVKAFNDYFEYDTLLTICERHLKNDDDPLFYQYARLETVLLKFMLHYRLRCLKNMISDENKFPLPLQIDEIVEYAAKLRTKLFSKLQIRSSLNLYQASLLMSSIMELLRSFKCPPMEYDLTKFIYIPKPQIPSLEKFVTFIEFYSFQFDPENPNIKQNELMYNDIEYQFEIMESLNDLCNTYNFAIDCTCFHKLIYHLGNDLFFDYIFIIVRVVMIKASFPKIIGIIFSKFAINSVEMSYIMNFITNFNRMEKMVQKNFKFKICFYIISNLDEIMQQMKPNNNRLMILDYMQKFIKSSLTRRERDRLYNSLLLATANINLSMEEEKLLIDTKNFLLPDKNCEMEICY